MEFMVLLFTGPTKTNMAQYFKFITIKKKLAVVIRELSVMVIHTM